MCALFVRAFEKAVGHSEWGWNQLCFCHLFINLPGSSEQMVQHNAAAELGLTLQMHLFHNEVIYLDSYLSPCSIGCSMGLIIHVVLNIEFSEGHSEKKWRPK